MTYGTPTKICGEKEFQHFSDERPQEDEHNQQNTLVLYQRSKNEIAGSTGPIYAQQIAPSQATT